MPLDLTPLNTASRLMVEAELKVATGGGGRFQPTGFPDLGPALYKGADGNDWLLVESPQSMANRMERVCWVDGASEIDRVGKYNTDCEGIPYVLATDADDNPLTASTLEAHRLASPYIWGAKPFHTLQEDEESKQVKNGETANNSDAVGQNENGSTIRNGETLPEYLRRLFRLAENRLVPWKYVADGLLKVDPACLLHGIWFSAKEFNGGKVRITRALSAYIEACSPDPANFGFQKRDAVSDRTDKEAGQSASEGFGSVIGPKQHFTSSNIKAYFQVDLERLRSYGLSNSRVQALAAWAIYKIRRVLIASRDGVPDLRTECKFELADSRPENGDEARPAVKAWLVNTDTGKHEEYELPEISDDLRAGFASLKDPNGEVTRVKWIPNIEGKAEVTAADFDESTLNRGGLENKTRFETQQPKKGGKKAAKRYFIVFGELNDSDKESLRTQNPDDPTKSIVNKAIKDYDKKREAKAQSREADSNDDSEADETGESSE